MGTVFLVCGIGIAGIIILIVLINISINVGAKKNAKKVADLYLNAVSRGNFQLAAKYISKRILSTESEINDWINKNSNCVYNLHLLNYKINNADFNTMSGNFTGEVYISFTGNYSLAGITQELHPQLLVIEEENEYRKKFTIINSPELVQEAKERLTHNFLSLQPYRKASTDSIETERMK